ncbi:hypothetical protein [Palleronia abyssalis]|uniref:Uncharacterized protein n=1 Tax=Palleronia abyssalis TaxID=1501240 RepID=A0A2R8BT01_9RHOB|nr:hypothetical protein [Palleronia abyssalis]SPJ23299.1 hypothetical protein PAA8504_01109 [Palleronia abyssalis]
MSELMIKAREGRRIALSAVRRIEDNVFADIHPRSDAQLQQVLKHAC